MNRLFKGCIRGGKHYEGDVKVNLYPKFGLDKDVNDLDLKLPIKK